MQAIITTTVAKLAAAWGSHPHPIVPGLSIISFGRFGIETPEFGRVLAIEYNNRHFWLDSEAGRIASIMLDTPIRICD